jgi:6-phosphogluconolactonase (cycloisomerase 2 family)
MNSARLFFLTGFILNVILLVAGCGGVNQKPPVAGGPPTPTPPATPAPSPSPASGAGTFLYVANNGSVQNVGGSISGFAVDTATGNLMPVPGSPFKAGEGPSAIAADPQGRLVFVGEDESVPGARGSNCTLTRSALLSETVDRSSGVLTQTGRITLDGVCVRAVAVDPTSKHLYVGMTVFGSSAGEIQGFSIGPSGSLTQVPGSPFHVNGSPSGIAVHPNGKFVYAATDSGLLVLTRDPTTGTLVQSGDFNTPKVKLALNPGGTFLAATELNTGEISQFDVDPTTGAVAARDARVPASRPAGIAADPLGSFFAATEVTDSATLAGGVSTMLLDSATHQLNKVAGSPFPSGMGPIDVVFDPTGKYVYAANRQENSVSGFALDRSSGKLAAVPGVHFATGDFPDALTVVKPQ